LYFEFFGDAQKPVAVVFADGGQLFDGRRGRCIVSIGNEALL